MSTAAAWIFWLSIAFLFYAYGGFALLVGLVGLVQRRGVRKLPITPSVSLIIAAYNEEKVIGERLENALAMDYPRDRLQILVASDGSTDRTDDIVASYASRGVLLLSLPRRGKIRTLNAAVARASGKILVFSDANIMCRADTLRELVANFADASVGGVAGHTTYTLDPASESSSYGERLYWRYDTWLKKLESQTGSIVSAHGGLYAIRRVLFRPVTDGAVTDDFAISTSVIAHGYRLVFEPNALATEVAVPEAQREFRRRVRLMTRGLRGVFLRRRLLNPRKYGFYSVILASHKLARRLVPVSLAILGVASLAAWSHGPLYQAAVLTQAFFYGMASVGYLLRRSPMGRLRLLYIPFYYCMANVACSVAWVHALRGRRIEVWQPQRQSLRP
ncbi:MAG TPA: glycosyltransferase family 2 protein [Vicinamibacterales bacterium]|nr:glycosyltransferase family 2 protein [Vicinamibacterales bacterium]